MKVSLLRGTKGEERDLLKQRFQHNKDLFDIVIELMKEDIESSLSNMRSPENYDKPAYAEYLADQLGYQRALAKYIAIMTLDQGDN